LNCLALESIDREEEKRTFILGKRAATWRSTLFHTPAYRLSSLRHDSTKNFHLCVCLVLFFHLALWSAYVYAPGSIVVLFSGRFCCVYAISLLYNMLFKKKVMLD
jgi:hypothetical protein